VLAKYLRDKGHDLHKRELRRIKPQTPCERLRTPQERLTRDSAGFQRTRKGVEGARKGSSDF
jgi:hypothetical protein